MNLVRRLCRGLRVLFDLCGMMLVGCLLLVVAAGIGVVYARSGGLAAVFILLCVLLALLAHDCGEEPEEETEFGATYDALRAEQRAVLEVSKKAHNAEHLAVAREEFNRYARINAAVKHGPGRNSVEL